MVSTYHFILPLHRNTTVLSLLVKTGLIQSILKRGLLALKGRQNNVLYQNIEIGVGIMIGDMGQPIILVSLCSRIL